MNNNILTIKPRSGCKDTWNAFMVHDCEFSLGTDIPICSSNAKIPSKLISYDDAKTICNKMRKSGERDFTVDAYIHFYIDDQKFDGKRNSIWLYPEKAYDIMKHFSGIITPDFSTNADFPDPLKRYNTYRMRAFGCWAKNRDIPVINNVRWGTMETWTYCFDGIPQNSIIAIGTVASNLKLRKTWPNFENGLYKMVKILKPKLIIVYGSSGYPFFDRLRNDGIEIITFPSKTCKAFSRGDDNE